MEDGIDDLIVELKRLGGMEVALESLRKVRRVVVRSHEPKRVSRGSSIRLKRITAISFGVYS